MKKRAALFTTALVTGAVLAAFSMNAYGAQITEEEARTIAFDDAGITEEDTVSSRVSAERDDGRQLLEVSFVTQNYEEYEYEILAESGLIFGASYEYEAASEGPGETTLEQARQIAAEHAGELEEDVTFTKEKTEKDDGRMIHELSFRTQDEKEFDYEISADEGAILGWDYDGKAHIAWIEKNQEQDPVLTEEGPTSGLEAAKAAALAKAGFDDTEVTWGRIHEDYEDGRPVYEGKFVHGTEEYEFEADAATGEIISWEMESIYD